MKPQDYVGRQFTDEVGRSVTVERYNVGSDTFTGFHPNGTGMRFGILPSEVACWALAAYRQRVRDVAHSAVAILRALVDNGSIYADAEGLHYFGLSDCDEVKLARAFLADLGQPPDDSDEKLTDDDRRLLAALEPDESTGSTG